MKANVSGATGNLRAVLTGVAVILVISLALAAVSAALIGGGLIPSGAMSVLAYGGAVAASLLGAISCGRQATSARLPLCLISCGIYLLLVFVLRGLIFRTVGTSLWIVPVCVLGGAVVGAMLSSRAKRRR